MADLNMSNHAKRPASANTTVIGESDAMPHHAKHRCDLVDGWNSEEHQCNSTISQPIQLCFESWSSAFDENDAAMPPPKILIGRGHRSRPQAKSATVNPPGYMCDAASPVLKSCSNLTTRARHNRCVGSSLLEAKYRDTWTSTTRSAEFEVFLQGL